jgi:hypothetical protein
MERAAYRDSFPGSRKSPCLGCGETVVASRDPHVTFVGRTDGSGLVEVDAEPLTSYAEEPGALIGATDLFLLGMAHRTCVVEARRNIRAGAANLPPDLVPANFLEGKVALPELHLPPTLERCPFCNLYDPTDEHVYPQWLSRELTSIGELVDPSGEHGPRKVHKLDTTAPVCADCNHRWLSVLENDTKPILAPMVRGENRRLLPEQQRLIAAWAAKTALMLDLASGSPIIPTGFFQEMRQQRRALRSHLVLVGAYTGERAARVDHRPLHVGIPTSEPPNGFVTTFNAFRVVFQVLGHFTVGNRSFTERRVFRDALGLLWPPRESAMDWPPNLLAFDDDWFDMLAASVQSSPRGEGHDEIHTDAS